MRRFSWYRSLIVILAITLLLGFYPAGSATAQTPVMPIYIVKPNDTLYDIAVKFRTSVDAIMSANGRTNADTLSIGDRLYIPSLEGMSGVLTTEFAPLGATLTSLSRRAQTFPANLVILNRLTSPAELFIGREIVVPQPENGGWKRTLPSLNAGESFMELALLIGQNPWLLAGQNRIPSPDYALPMDTYFATSDIETAATLSIPGIESIELDNLPFTQGNTWVVKVKSQEDVQVTAELAGAAPPFFELAPGEQIAYGGIRALQDVGVYPLTLTVTTQDQASYRFEQYVFIGSGNFSTDNPLYVDPATIEDSNTMAEDKIFKELVQQVTPAQQWSGQWLYPTIDPCQTSAFGSRRTYIGDDRLYYHTGLDLGYCGGIDVFAPAAGTVVGVKPEQIVRGNALVIDHGMGVFSIYMHLKDFNVSEGQQVQPGDLLGHLGNTGRSTGAHLHFEIDVNGIPVNPIVWLGRTFP